MNEARPEGSLEAPLPSSEFEQFMRLARRLPLRWTASVRRRRLLLLALAAPGFLAVFTTPLHQNFLVLLFGLTAFAAAFVFRARTERMFVRAEAAAVWPPGPPANPPSPERSHA